MRCPYCHDVEDKVVDSRVADAGAAIRRRRECLGCGRRFTTFERVEEVPLFVVKRSGAREPFDRGKVVDGIRRAAKNRPISAADIEALGVAVEEQVRELGVEVGTEAVGRAVLDQLRALDPVSYLRFASVYKGFEDVTDFEREVGLLQKTTSPKPKPGEPAA
ncbi:MAG TPA: transcriptional regulator NrdR [Acidimicrobiia bacterium]|nr:transcriptional regulator NrdR [Acidimicrobiia bacterium]